jgi:hypothetical protein
MTHQTRPARPRVTTMGALLAAAVLGLTLIDAPSQAASHPGPHVKAHPKAQVAKAKQRQIAKIRRHVIAAANTQLRALDAFPTRAEYKNLPLGTGEYFPWQRTTLIDAYRRDSEALNNLKAAVKRDRTLKRVRAHLALVRTYRVNKTYLSVITTGNAHVPTLAPYVQDIDARLSTLNYLADCDNPLTADDDGYQPTAFALWVDEQNDRWQWADEDPIYQDVMSAPDHFYYIDHPGWFSARWSDARLKQAQTVTPKSVETLKAFRAELDETPPFHPLDPTDPECVLPE